MRTLDDIIVGFFIFFIIDRAIRLFGNMIIEPWVRTKVENPAVVENWKVGIELISLVIATIIVFKYKPLIQKLNIS